MKAALVRVAMPAGRIPAYRGVVGHVTFGMLTSVDGYVAGPPDGSDLPMFGDELHRHFNEKTRVTALCVYGRALYEVMRYWETDEPGRSDAHEEFAALWRQTPKVVVSTTLAEVGPNATLVRGVDDELERIIATTPGDIDVGGPTLAAALGAHGLIDEYHVYVRPAVLGGGKPFFAGGTTLELRLLDVEQLPDDTVLLRYAPLTADRGRTRPG